MAANCRAEWNCEGSVTAATIAEAVIGPLPGMPARPARLVVLVPGQDRRLDLLHPAAQRVQFRHEFAECLASQCRHPGFLAHERGYQVPDTADPLGRDDAQFGHVR